MGQKLIKTFVSYHHARDQAYKDALVKWAVANRLIQDMSVDTGEIDDGLSSETIRRRIRDDYLRDAEVTVLLCGAETRYRKHVDWEIKSTMIDGTYNRRSGILVVNLPTSGSQFWYSAFQGEQEIVYPDYMGGWESVDTKARFEELYPNMPRRILENLVQPGVKISIVPWDRVYGHTERFNFLLNVTAAAGPSNNYDLSRPMRRKNFNPSVDFIDFRV